MTSNTTKADSSQLEAETAPQLFDNWFDPIETEVRARAREFIEELIRGELDAVLARPRYGRSQMAGSEGRAGVAGHRHGSRTRSLTGTFEVILLFPTDGIHGGKVRVNRSRILRRRRLLCWFAENAATTFAQTSPLLAHARGNTLHIRNF